VHHKDAKLTVPYSQYNDNVLTWWISQAERVGDRHGAAMFRKALAAARRRLPPVPPDSSELAAAQVMRSRPAAAEQGR
jgi:hypothetical protein